MELSLKDAVEFISVITKLDKYSIVLWLSLTIPLFYIAFKKLAPDSTVAQPSSLTQKISQWLTIPKVETYVLFFSLCAFIAGNIIAVLGQQHKEHIRNIGWAVKNHMINTGYYSMAFKDIIEASHFNEAEIFEAAKTYPQEFSIVFSESGKVLDSTDYIKLDSLNLKIVDFQSYKDSLLKKYKVNDSFPIAASYNLSSKANDYFKYKKAVTNKIEASITTIVLCDSAKNFLISRSEKILAAYLSNDGVLHANDLDIMPFDKLFSQNNLFTYPVIYKLIADSSHKFTFNVLDTANLKKGFGIVRKKYPPG